MRKFNLLIYSKTRYHCATYPALSIYIWFQIAPCTSMNKVLVSLMLRDMGMSIRSSHRYEDVIGALAFFLIHPLQKGLCGCELPRTSQSAYHKPESWVVVPETIWVLTHCGIKDVQSFSHVSFCPYQLRYNFGSYFLGHFNIIVASLLRGRVCLDVESKSLPQSSRKENVPVRGDIDMVLWQSCPNEKECTAINETNVIYRVLSRRGWCAVID